MADGAGSSGAGRERETTAEPAAGAVAEHIARAAARLFAARGYDATSVREIVEAAGVTKPTLYYYYKSKEALAQALVSDPMERMADEMRRRFESEADPVEALGSMIQAKLDFCVEDPDRARFFYAIFFGPLATGVAAEVARCGERMDLSQEAATRRLIEAGLIDPERAETFCLSLHGAVIVSTVEFLYRDRPIAPDLGRRLVTDLLRGFGRPPAGSAARPSPEPEPAPNRE